MDIKVDFGNMYTKELEAFGRAVLGEGEIPVTAKDAIASQKIIEAAYTSSKTKQYVIQQKNVDVKINPDRKSQK